MFQAKKSDITPDSLIVKGADAFLIKPGDILEFNIFSNKGFRLVDFGVEGRVNQQMRGGQQLEYVVLKDSTVVLPIIGATKISGLSREEAIAHLEEVYSEYINDPLVFLKVINWRVYVFSGIGEAKIVSITDINTDLLRILAEAGGVPINSKAYKVKIIRGGLNAPIIRTMDLSRISKMKLYDLNIQAEDIIYIEPVLNISTGLLSQVSPILSLTTTILLIYSLANP
jgi:Periplasmic protein involved in polysaccharide export